jgi:zinc transport system substrate-binding protein
VVSLILRHSIVCLLLVLILGCSSQEQKTDKINIAVSILPLAEFTEKIGGERVTVSVMVPPGASPHTYEPIPSQLKDVSKAKMYVKVGSPIEFELTWLGKILSTNKDMFLVDASPGIELVSVEPGHPHESTRRERYDPHIWLSPRNAKIMAENICNGFISIDPKNKKYYTQNKEKYLKELDNLDHNIEQLLVGKINRKFMVYHPAWGYFAKDYNLEQISVEIEGKKPTAKSIQYLIEQAKDNSIKVVFTSPQFNTESAKVIAREMGGRVVFINSLEKDYIPNMKRVAQALSEAME